MAADPRHIDRVNEYLTRIDTINRAIIRLASTRAAN
jgi:hypothetical protein